MSTNENTPISGQFWDWMQSYWHTNRDFPPAHPDWRKKADLVDGKVPAGQLPSYVDDVLEFNSYADLPQSGEKGKIYITTKDNKQFRWGGSAYIEINSCEKVESKIINGSYNANDLSKNSITYGYSVANAPSTVGAHSFTVLNLDTTNPDYKMQLGFDGDTNEMFSRIKSNGNWSDWSKYTASSQLGNLLTTNTGQDVTAQKWFKNASGGNNWNNNQLILYGNNGSKAGLTFFSETMDIGTLDFDGYFHFKISDYTYVKARGFIKNGSDDNYILLGGGGHKSVSDFALSNQLITYEDNRLIYPDELSPTKLKYGFTSWNNDGNNSGTWADFLHFGGYPDSSGGKQNLIVFKKNGGFGIRQYQASFQAANPYDQFVDYWHSGNFNPSEYATQSWVSDRYISKAIIFNSNFNDISPNTSGIYRADSYAPGVKSIYSPMLHLGGYDVKSQLQIQYANGNDDITGELSYRGGFNNFWGAWRTAWDNVNFNPDSKVSANNSQYSLDWDGFQTYLKRNGNLEGYLFHSGNFDITNYYKKIEAVHAINAYDADPLNSFNELNGKTKIGSINADGGWWHVINIQHRNGVGDGVNYSGQLRFGMTANTNTMQFRQQYDGKWLPWKTIWNSDDFNPAQYVLQSSLNSQLSNYFNKFAIDYIGASHDLNSLSKTGFYNVGHGTVGDATSYLNNTGAKALLHLQSEDPYTALQIQSHRYNGNLISRSKSDGVFSTWIRHWGDNDFTAADMSRWNNSINKSSASEEVIVEDDTLKIQPDEFSLEGSGSYDIGSKKKLVHILLREGKEVNIRNLTRRQTIVVFNFSKDPINLNIEGLKPYPLSPEMQVTLYISDEGEVMLYNENSFKKLQ